MQQSSRNYPVATIQSQAKPKAGRFLTTGTRRNPRNAAFQLNQTTSRCSLDWFLKSTADHPVAIQFLPRLVLQFIDWSFSHERNDCQTQHKLNN
ncbi:TPR-like protein [Dorcoceras hygrometricum]|uniref:TPR-like protein n=1 Tax=Dorcoceras hygrometricum TaxID=472368 RepID=A0A2Z7A3T4_9LAMI|nr:TPR-like protein [Dorcoceras hygrometricum]